MLYPTNPNLDALQDPINEIEIEIVVKQLARNKASSPDGLPNEFLQVHWSVVKEQVISLIKGFCDHTVDLSPINQANIVIIPTKDVSQEVGDYRPISVINAVLKLISKILANRLGGLLPSLIAPCQTDFIHGRQITENFNATREILHHISKNGKPAAFIKVDFAKAFDSVNWSFLKRVMVARRFPDKWIKWIDELLIRASSRVVSNGGHSNFFKHKKGLRQGDPLSPMLFDIAVDVFQKMIEVLNNSLNSMLTRKLRSSVIVHQYADDTVLISKADNTTVVSLKIILRLFTSVSGLEINYGKSSWIPINVDSNQVPIISAILGCAETNFLIIYLGLPLTLHRPSKELFMPLIEKVEQKLEGWKSRLILRGGRLLLMNSVLSSIPIYFMSSFLLPK